MFFNREYIPAVPIREEQRQSEEEELARQLKREARIFFPDKKLPDFDGNDLPPLPEEGQDETVNPLPERTESAPIPAKEGKSWEAHDKVCREEDSLLRNGDGGISPHEIRAARQEAEQIAKARQKATQSFGSLNDEIGLQNEGEPKNSRPRLNKQDIRRGVRLKIILDKPRGLKPWKEDNF